MLDIVVNTPLEQLTCRCQLGARPWLSWPILMCVRWPTAASTSNLSNWGLEKGRAEHRRKGKVYGANNDIKTCVCTAGTLACSSSPATT